MSRELILSRAQLNLIERGVEVIRENDTLYVLVNDNQLELSEFEINFQCNEWIEKTIEP